MPTLENSHPADEAAKETNLPSELLDDEWTFLPSGEVPAPAAQSPARAQPPVYPEVIQPAISLPEPQENHLI